MAAWQPCPASTVRPLLTDLIAWRVPDVGPAGIIHRLLTWRSQAQTNMSKSRTTFANFAIAATVSCLLLSSAHAQMFKDPGLQSLYAADQHTELQRQARERLTTQPKDTQAVLALSLAALATNDAPARQGAITRAEACIQDQPQAAVCHYALGVVLGVQAMSEGMLKAARSASTVKTALTQAQMLEPTWYPARSALTEFHLMAPGMMGGSTTKAAELARSASTPEQVRLLSARVDAQDASKMESALATFTGLLSSSDLSVAEDATSWGNQASAKLIGDGKAPAAQAFFERLLKDRPGETAGPFGLARVRAEGGAHEQALKLYDQAAQTKGAAHWPIEYRRGIALQELGRKDDARAAFNRFVASGKGQKKSLDDARKRLEQLGA